MLNSETLFIDNYKKLKQELSTNQFSNNLIIFLNDQPFLVDQYIKKILEISKSDASYIDDLNCIFQSELFSNSYETKNIIKIIHLKEFKCTDKTLSTATNAIVIADSIKDEDTIEMFKSHIIQLTKIPDWGLKDYIYSNISIKDECKDWLLEVCGKNPFRISQEVDKLKLFEPYEQEELFSCFMKDSTFSDLSTYNIFDFINAIMDKNIPKLLEILIERKNIDLEPLGIITLLYKNIFYLISMQLGINATSNSLNISDKQFNFLKRRLGRFSDNKLKEMLEFLITFDSKLKTGYLDSTNVEQQIDYILVNIL